MKINNMLPAGAALIAIALVMVSCGKKSVADIRFSEGQNITNLSKYVSSIELIPLSRGGAGTFSQHAELALAGGDYIIADIDSSKIFRYSAKGDFLNEIGSRGNADGQFNGIGSFQVIGGDVIVFSRLGETLRYSLDGKLVSSATDSKIGYQSYVLDKDTLTYFGHQYPKRANRLALMKDNTEFPYLEDKVNVFPLTSTAPVFSQGRNGVDVVDSYSPSIYCYNNMTVSKYLKFDFGPYTIKPEFFAFADAFQSAGYLLRNDFAVIYRFMESTQCRLVEVSLQKHPSGSCYVYGLQSGKSWRWFNCGSGENSSIFAESVKAVDGKTLYCLMDPSLFSSQWTGRFAGLTGNPGILGSIDPEGSYVIAKITLK